MASKKFISDTDKKLIIADYLQTGSMRETAKNCNVSISSVKRAVDRFTNGEVKERLESIKKENETKDIIEYMQSKQDETKRVLDKLLKGIEVRAEELDDKLTDIKGLATAYGIILDKQLKLLELQRGSANTEQISKVEELLSKLESEAQK